MKLLTLIAVGLILAGGVVTGVFLSENEVLTAEDLRRLRKFSVAKLKPSDAE